MSDSRDSPGDPRGADHHEHSRVGNDAETEMCTYCPKLCRHACPVSAADVREVLIPQQKMQTLGDLRRGKIGWSSDRAAPVYGCTGCGLCTNYCAHEIPVARVLLASRGELSQHGVASPALAQLAVRHQARDRALVGALRSRFASDDFAPARGGSGVAFLPGCDACISEDGLDDVASGLSLLRALLSGTRLGDRSPAALAAVTLVRLDAGAPLCGGQPLHSAGDDEALVQIARRQARSLAGYRVVVMSCPGCTELMRKRYADLGVALAPRIVHLTELLEPFANRLAEQKAAHTSSTPVHYHDPCHLGRGLGVYDAPRRLLASAGLEVAEFAWSRSDSQCSGGGGLLPITMPDTATAMARRRLAEVEGSSAPVRVVTACPTCKRSLSKVAGSGTTVVDIARALADAIR